MSYEAAALCEPLAVGVRAGSRAGVSLGSKVLICGAGTPHNRLQQNLYLLQMLLSFIEYKSCRHTVIRGLSMHNQNHCRNCALK